MILYIYCTDKYTKINNEIEIYSLIIYEENSLIIYEEKYVRKPYVASIRSSLGSTFLKV